MTLLFARTWNRHGEEVVIPVDKIVLIEQFYDDSRCAFMDDRGNYGSVEAKGSRIHFSDRMSIVVSSNPHEFAKEVERVFQHVH